MKNYSVKVKKTLNKIIDEMSENRDRYVVSPGHDFTRNRKLTFQKFMTLMLSMGNSTIANELLDFFSYDAKTITTSGFIQQRKKVLPYAFEYLFNKFTYSYKYNLYKGYRFLAVDGTTLTIPLNRDDHSTYIKPSKVNRGYNSLHLTALYDLTNKTYMDAIVAPIRKNDERKCLIEMVKRSPINVPTIVTADRLYESYNLFAHIENKNWNYLIRAKNPNSTGILKGLSLPKSEEFDVTIDLALTFCVSKSLKKTLKGYKRIGGSSHFDLLPNRKGIYPMSLRILRIKTGENKYTCLITNLDREKFSVENIHALYKMRWGIETSFRELKYSIGLRSFHSKSVTCITQEIFARLVMYNFSSIITRHVTIEFRTTKYNYHINFAVAIRVCKHFLSYKSNARPPDVEEIIKTHILPIRENRSANRKIKGQSAVSFIYRLA